MTPELHFKSILAALGQNESREGLAETPRRYIKFLREFMSPDPFVFTTFDSDGADQMIVQTNIPFYSLCEHHVVPFFGFATVGYIPNGRIVGLSKLARTVDWYSRGLQNQERITTLIAERIQAELSPLGVGVSLKAEHLCMAMRGVKKPDTYTVTTKLIGAMKDESLARSEFMSYIK